MNIYLDLWLIYLINLLPGMITILKIIIILFVVSVFFHAFGYLLIGDALNDIYKKFDREQEPSEKEKIEKQIANQISFQKKTYKRGAFCMFIVIFIMFLLIFIPDKKDAIQLVKVNYINQSNMVLDDNSIDALSSNIDTILNSK